MYILSYICPAQQSSLGVFSAPEFTDLFRLRRKANVMLRMLKGCGNSQGKNAYRFNFYNALDSFIYVVRNAKIVVHFLLAGSVAVSTHMYSVLVGSVSFFIMRSNCSCNSVNVSKLKRWYSSSCKSFSRMHPSWSLFRLPMPIANVSTPLRL